MNPMDFIKTKQIFWGKKNGFSLMDSEGGSSGREAYLEDLSNNFFEELDHEVEQHFIDADGGELAGDIAKMQALHSSAALAINVFGYWREKDNLTDLLHSCRLCQKSNKIEGKITFEKKFVIDSSFSIPPNLDIVIENTSFNRNIDIYAIESKFSEPYFNRNNNKGLKPKYIKLNIWDDIPNIKELAIEICPEDNKFEILHAAQLIKHILGLKVNSSKSKFRLLYLYYDIPGPVSAQHTEEIEEFQKITRSDNINFHHISYQELIINLAKKFNKDHEKYIYYIMDRYL